MFKSGVFDYADVINKAADASWLRHQAIANNIANIDTPGYKRVDVDFESVLEYELRHFQYEPLDVKVKNVHLNRLDVGTYVDAPDYSYRIDKNNVDIDQEASQLAKNQIKYQGVMLGIQSEFTNLQNAMRGQ